MNKEEKFKILERIDLWIKNVDTKIAYLLAFLGIITTIIFTNDSIIEKIKICLGNLLHLNQQDIINIISLIVIMLVVTLMVFIVRSIYYLLKASNANITVNGLNNGSVLFFGSIAMNTLEQFKEKIKKQTDKELEDDIIEQIFINSQICNEKMQNYNKAIKNAKISLIMLGIIFFIIIFM